MTDNNQHWLVSSINKSQPDALPQDAVPASAQATAAWRLVHRNFGLPYESIAKAVADAFGLITVDTRSLRAPTENPFSQKICRKLGVFPYALESERPVIATCDPRITPDNRQQIRFLLGRDFDLAIVSPDDLDTALTFLYSHKRDSDDRKTIDVASNHDQSGNVQLAMAIFREAIDKRASDIHIHPFVGGAAIRFRIDGIMVRVATVPKEALDGLAKYLNVQASLETNPFIPQDGRLSLKYGLRRFDVRLSLLPAFDGLRIVCRLLEQGRQFSLFHSGFSLSDLQMLKRLVDWGAGIVLLTGPTGSGKTSTLYALLSELNTSEVNILTLEDPVEYVLPGISQIQVNEAQGRSFAETLRAMLRQDPDIVLVGEIRDSETAQIATQASLTGHLVLSTLHTNDATSTIPRLIDLGLDPTLLADALVGVVAQRLVRKLCVSCKAPVAKPLNALEAEFLRITREAPTYRAVGCKECGYSGYKGRIPVTEIMEVSSAMRGALLNGDRDVNALRAVNKGYQTSMALGAAQWIVSGETTPEETYRELGLRFWNELATCHQTNFSGSLEGFRGRSGHRPGIMLLSDRVELPAALADALHFDVVAVKEEGEAAAALKDNASILAIIIDSSLLRSEPEQWLSSLRAQLAWSGVPVLFLLRTGSENLQRILDNNNAYTLVVREDVDLAQLVSRKLSAILESGDR